MLAWVCAVVSVAACMPFILSAKALAEEASSVAVPSGLVLTRTVNGQMLPSDSSTNDAAVTLSWNQVSGAQHYRVVTTRPDGTTQGSTPAQNQSFTLTDTAFGTQQGTWGYQVQAEDDEGAWSELSTLVTLNFDDIRPSINVKPDSVGNAQLNTFESASFTFYDAGGVVKTVLNGNQTITGPNTTSYLDGITPGVGSALYGMNTIAVEDSAGNQETYLFTLDAAAPGQVGVPFISIPTTGRTTTWTWSPAIDAESSVKGYEYALTPEGQNPADDGWSFTTDTSVATTAPADGGYQLHVRALDILDHRSNAVTGPVETYVTPGIIVNPISATTAGATITVTGTISQPVDSLFVTVFGQTYEVMVDSTSWTFFVDTTGVAAGTYTLTVSGPDATDASALVQRSFVVLAPVAATTTPEEPAQESTPAETEPAVAALSVTPLITSPTEMMFDEDLIDVTLVADTAGSSAATSGLARTGVGVNNTDGQIAGIKWYWWLTMIAALAFITSWIVRAIRRRQT